MIGNSISQPYRHTSSKHQDTTMSNRNRDLSNARQRHDDPTFRPSALPSQLPQTTKASPRQVSINHALTQSPWYRNTNIEPVPHTYPIQTSPSPMDIDIPISTPDPRFNMTPPGPMFLELPTTTVSNTSRHRSSAANSAEPTTAESSPRGTKQRFACDICGQTISREHDIDRHKRNMHGVAGGLQFNCQYVGMDGCAHTHPFRKDKLKDHYEARHRGRSLPVITATPGNHDLDNDDQGSDVEDIGNHDHTSSTQSPGHGDAGAEVVDPLDQQLSNYPSTFGTRPVPESRPGTEPLVFYAPSPPAAPRCAQPKCIVPGETLRGFIDGNEWTNQGHASPNHATYSSQTEVEAIRDLVTIVSHNSQWRERKVTYNRFTNSQLKPHQQPIPDRDRHESYVPPLDQQDNHSPVLGTQFDPRRRMLPEQQSIVDTQQSSISLQPPRQLFYGKGDPVTLVKRPVLQQPLDQYQQGYPANCPRQPSIVQPQLPQGSQAQYSSAESWVLRQQTSPDFQHQGNSPRVSRQPRPRPQYTLQLQGRSDQFQHAGYPASRQQPINQDNYDYLPAPYPGHGQ